MLSAETILTLQKRQFQHDRRNHCDILSLHKIERLKHYGLHFCKYVGRLARGMDESKTASETTVDAFLVSLSAANTLHQKLIFRSNASVTSRLQFDHIGPLADAAGRFADACEKIDHLEEFTSIARSANQDIFDWVICCSQANSLDILHLVNERRKVLASRHFYIED